MINKPHPDRHQLQCLHGILERHYPTTELERIPKALIAGIEISDNRNSISLQVASQIISAGLRNDGNV